MNCPKAIVILLLAFFGFFSSPADAQVNLKTGYNFSILSDEGIDRIIADYNQTQPFSSPFGKLHWLHGFEVGLRFKADLHAFEITYQSSYQTLKAIGVSTNQEYTDKLRFGIHAFALGYQAANRFIGLGADLQYQFYRTKFTPGQTPDVFKNTQNMLAVKMYLMLTLQGQKGVDMALQPYYVLPFQNYNLDPLAAYLHVEPSSSSERWNRFGITLLFYNGDKGKL